MKAPTLASLPAPLFDLRQTLESGQVFHWHPQSGGSYRGLIGSTPVEIQQDGAHLRVTPGAEALAARYFALDHDLEAIYATFALSDDPALASAVDACRGVRLIRQPLWECLATFITSAMKQVAHIRQISLALRTRFGQPVPGNILPAGWEPLAAYPSPERLARATEAELRACGLGFRAANLRATARLVASGKADLEALRRLGDDELLARLCELPGVGPKIANCVLLFGYERLGAFPIDVWIRRVLLTRYFKGKRQPTPARLREFAAQNFGPYGGYAQQYLFHSARTEKRKRAAG